MITYFFKTHQHKAKPLIAALRANGLRPSRRNPDIAFFDTPATAKTTGMFLERGAVIMEYPHTAIAPWWYDNVFQFPDFVKCVFVTGQSHQDAMRIIEPRAHTRVIGFPHAPIAPFKKGCVKRIMFAPIHPSRRWIRPEAREANRRILDTLSALEGYDIYCRAIGNLEMQGVEERRGITLLQGAPDGSWRHASTMDLVIAEGMFMYLSIARGIPTIGINQNISNRTNDPEMPAPERWDEYGHLFAYPVDFDDAPFDELVERAMVEPVEWKRRCMPKFNAKKFAEMVVEEYHEKRRTDT